MRNLVIINGCPSTIVTSPHHHHHHHHFLPHNKPQLPFLSLHNFTFLSLSNPTALSNHTQTKLELTCYAKTPSNLIEDGSFNGFGLVGKTVLRPTVDGPGLGPLREGKVDDGVGVLGFLAQLNVGVLRLVMELLKGVCFNLPFVVELLGTLAGFKFSIEDLMKRSGLNKSNDEHSPRLAVRKEVNNGSTRVGDRGSNGVEFLDRRRVLLSSVGSIAFCLLNNASFSAALAASSRSDYADMPALRGKDYGKTKMRYPDYTETETGLQFKDLRVGTGPTPKIGDTVVIDWDGYTIGYYGRIFEARNKTKGGSFEGDDKAFFRFKLGSQEVIPAFEEAIVGMSLGGVRRIIVPPELGYPGNDYNQKGPRPTTFSGQRALDFVLRNQGLIDKTLLFDIELLKIIPN